MARRKQTIGESKQEPRKKETPKPKKSAKNLTTSNGSGRKSEAETTESNEEII